MKQVFVSQHLFEVEMCKERLEQAGISSLIKNQRTTGLAGEIPFTEVFPELWVVQDEEYDRARRFLTMASWHYHRTKKVGSVRDVTNATKASLRPAGSVAWNGPRIELYCPDIPVLST
jgi:hypothetical protein